MSGYLWDEVRIRVRVEALGLNLAVDLNESDRFPILDAELLPVGVIRVLRHGFWARLASRTTEFAVSSPTLEQEFFTALVETSGVPA